MYLDTTATVSTNCVQLAFDEARRDALGYVAYQASSSSDVRCAAHTADKGGLGFTISDALVLSRIRAISPLLCNVMTVHSINYNLGRRSPAPIFAKY